MPRVVLTAGNTERDMAVHALGATDEFAVLHFTSVLFSTVGPRKQSLKEVYHQT